jgi:hypothetical protein
MYSGYEVPRDRNLLNSCDRSCLDGWAAPGPSYGHDSAHVELFTSPDSPGLFAFKGPRETGDLVGATATDGLGTLDIDPLFREEQVAQGAVTVGATLCGEHRRCFEEAGASHVCLD